MQGTFHVNLLLGGYGVRGRDSNNWAVCTRRIAAWESSQEVFT